MYVQRMPEQHFDSLVGSDRSENIRASIADYMNRVEGNIAVERERQEADALQRVDAKRTQRYAYLATVSNRLAKEARAFGGDEPLKVQW